jgi:hypothetical protein
MSPRETISILEDPTEPQVGQLVSGVWYIGDVAYATAKIRMNKRTGEVMGRLIVRHVLIEGMTSTAALHLAKTRVFERRREIEGRVR